MSESPILPPDVEQGPQPPRPPRRRSRLLEGVVGLGLLLGLSGVVAPGVMDELEEQRVVSATRQMQLIVEGLRAYSQDTLTFPTGRHGRTNVSWLYSPGELPEGNPFADGGEARTLADVLIDDTMGGMAWQGPYIDELAPDPWGRAFLVNVQGLVTGRERAMVLSAGPDGVVQSEGVTLQPAGDDILLALN